MSGAEQEAAGAESPEAAAEAAPDSTPGPVPPLEPPPVPEPEPAPPDAERDAIAELERMEKAQSWAMPADEPGQFVADPLAGAEPAEPLEAPPLFAPPQPVAEPAPPAPSMAPQTLEDLYHRHPDIGNGQKYLRVDRKSPATWNGVKIAGWLDDVHEQISLSDFGARFGGGLYEVTVMGPGRGLDAAGEYNVRTLERVRVEVSGKPIPVAPRAQETNVMRPGVYPSPLDSSVEIARINREKADDERRDHERMQLTQQLLSSRQGPDDLFQHVEAISDRRANEVRESLNHTVAALRAQIDQQQRQLSEAQARITHLQEENLRIQSESAKRLSEEESTRLRELKSQHSSELQRITDDHSRTIERMAEREKAAISEMTDRHARERQQTADAESRERDRQRDDAARREKQLIDDAKMREENLRIQYEGRLKDLERSLERELRSVKEQRDRELTQVQTAESGKATVTEKAAQIETEALRTEIARRDAEALQLRAECQELRSEKEQLRENLMKDPITAVTEARNMLEVLGVGDKGAEEGEFDWKRGLVQLGKNFLEKAPEIAKSVEGARAQNQHNQHAAAAIRQRQMQGYAPPHPAMAPPQRMAAPGQPPPQAPPQPQVAYRPDQLPGMAPPPSWEQPPAQPAAPAQQNPIASAEPPAPPVAPPAAGAEATGGEFTPGFAGADEPPAPPAAEPAEPPVTAGEPAAEPAPPGAPVEVAPEVAEKLMAFAENLDAAIGTGLVSPPEFAQQVLDELGPETTHTIITSLGPDELADQVASYEGGQGTQIVTREGRKYLQELWAAAAALLEQQGFVAQ